MRIGLPPLPQSFPSYNLAISDPHSFHVGGHDVTELFYSLHKSEVLLRPQYQRLQIGTVAGQEEQFKPLPAGSLSPVPYGGV